MTTPTNLILTTQTAEASGDGYTQGVISGGQVIGGGNIYVTVGRLEPRRWAGRRRRSPPAAGSPSASWTIRHSPIASRAR